MPAFQEKDFFKRQIEQLAAALKRVLQLRKDQKYDEAQQALDDARHTLVGVPRMLLEQVDASSAAALIREPIKMRIWARLLREQAGILEEQGQDGSFQLANAVQVMLEALSRSSPTDDDRSFLKEVLPSLPEGSLGAAYQARLDQLRLT